MTHEMKYIRREAGGDQLGADAGLRPRRGPKGPSGRGQHVHIGKGLAEGPHSTSASYTGPDFLVEKDQEYCVCEMPCNLTRYGKELSMVKIPSKASAKYLAKKFNKSEQYIG